MTFSRLVRTRTLSRFVPGSESPKQAVIAQSFTLTAVLAYTLVTAVWAARTATSSPVTAAVGAAASLVALASTCLLVVIQRRCTADVASARKRLKRQEQWDEAVVRITRAAESGISLEESLRLVLDSGIQVLGADTALIVLRDHRGDFVVRACRNTGSMRVGYVIGQRDWATAAVIRQRQLVLVRDYQAYEGAIPEMVKQKIQVAIAAPLLTGTDIAGAVLFAHDRQVSHYDADGIEFVELLAKQLSAAVVNAGLLDEVRRRADYLTTLNEISMSLVSVLEPAELFEKIYGSVCQVLSLDAFFVANVLDGGDEADVTFLVEKDVRSPSHRVKASDSPTWQVIRSGRPMLHNLDDPGDSKGFVTLQTHSDEQMRSVMIAPMRSGGRVIGAISAQSYEAQAYGEDELELLVTVANSAAVALENARLYRAARELSMTDDLTGLGNYRMFQDILSREIARAERYSTHLSLIMVDSDSLKKINDTFGHSAGDLHLKGLARAMTAVARKSDYVMRYAGDEFMLILPNTSLTDAVVVAERLRSHVEQFAMAVCDTEVAATISIGVASYPESGRDVDTMLASADQALYKAKRSGKNRVSVV